MFLPLCLLFDWKNWILFPCGSSQSRAASTQPPHMPRPCQTKPLHKWKMSPACLQKPEGARGLTCLFVYLVTHSFNCFFTSSLILSGTGRVPPMWHARGTQPSGPDSVLTAQYDLKPWWGPWDCYCRKFFWTVLVLSAFWVIWNVEWAKTSLWLRTAVGLGSNPALPFAGCPWASDFTSLNLTTLISKMGYPIRALGGAY